jgi:4a-hydroxytetrahydrobiopterin dehydratase
MADELKTMKCVACREGAPTATEEEIAAYKPQIPDWDIVEEGGMKRLRREYTFKNFKQALAFTDAVGAAAEEQGHHPLIMTEWGKVTLEWWTHKIGGLHENDFIMAARSDKIYEGQQGA